MRGSAIHPSAAPVVEQLGGDVSGFVARQLTTKIASTADLVITMTRQHSDAVLELAPRQLRKTFTLIDAARLVTEWNARTVADLAALRPHLVREAPPDIPDPIGRDKEFFMESGAQIAELLSPIIELCRMNATENSESN